MIDFALWAVPVAVLVGGAWRPRWGLLVFFAALPLFGSPPGGPYLAQLDCAALAVIATAWRASGSRPSPLDRGVTAFAAAGLLSLWPLAYLPPSFSPRGLLGLAAALPGAQAWGTLFTWRSALDLLIGWALFLCVRRVFAGASLRPLGQAVAVGLAASLVIGFCEPLGWINLWAYRPIGRPLYDDRLHSLFFHSGWFAEYLVVATPFAVGALASGGRRSRAAAAVLVAAAGAALLLTQQRGGWLTSLAELATVAALSLPAWRRAGRRALWRTARWVAAGILVAALLVGAVLVARVDMRHGLEARLAEAVSDLSTRTWVWQAATALALERPLLGWGLGIWSPLLDAAAPDERNSDGHHDNWLTAHSLYFHVLAERGLLGLLTLGWVAVLAAAAVRRALHGGPGTESAIVVGLAASGVGFAVYGLVQYLFFIRSIAWLSWGLLGAVSTLPGAAPDTGGRWTALHGRRLYGTLAALALIVATVRPFVWVNTPPTRGRQTYGLYAPEVSDGGDSFRWTDGHAAERLPWRDSILVLRLANGHPEGRARPVEVVVRVDGRVVDRRTLHSGWETARLELGEPRAESLLLEIEARPTFRPYRLPAPAPLRSRDIRRLGVALAAVEWESASVGDAGVAATSTLRVASGPPA